MNSNTVLRKTYDHRVREVVWSTQDPKVFDSLSIPRATVHGWLHKGPRPVVSVDTLSKTEQELQVEVLRLQKRIQILTTIMRLLITLIKVSGFRLDQGRVVDGSSKERILAAVGRARAHLSMRSIFSILHLEPTRYYSWKRHADCGLDDQSSCPHTSPTQLTKDEVLSMKGMVTSKQYRHMPIRTLCYYAQRLGKVVASQGVWYKMIRLHDWKRPRMRIYPKKATLGIRAAKPNEIWHIDTTIIRVLDGTKAYLHAVIDNYSRKILSWVIADHLNIESTCTVLLEAAKFLEPKQGQIPTLVCDSGTENVNGKVDELILSGLFRRILAQVEVAFSNSMIEAFWRSLRHQWLYLNNLSDLTTVRRLIKFYVHQHNEVMPHAAFKGQTPDEMYWVSCTMSGWVDTVPARVHRWKCLRSIA